MVNDETSQAEVHYLVFSGHRIDSPSRETPRFPASAEEQAARMIAEAIEAEVAQYGFDGILAISSCANGGDILFLETCTAHNIPTEIYLASCADRFVVTSVEGPGTSWVERFHRLYKANKVHVLNNDDESPLNVYQQTNLRMLNTALTSNSAGVTVMVLWDGESGDGGGGTKDMVQIASKVGASVVHLDAKELLT